MDMLCVDIDLREDRFLVLRNKTLEDNRKNIIKLDSLRNMFVKLNIPTFKYSSVGLVNI